AGCLQRKDAHYQQARSEKAALAWKLSSNAVLHSAEYMSARTSRKSPTRRSSMPSCCSMPRRVAMQWFHLVEWPSHLRPESQKPGRRCTRAIPNRHTHPTLNSILRYTRWVKASEESVPESPESTM